MGIHKRTRMDNTKIVVLTQMGIEIPESIYEEFLEYLDRDGWVDVPATVMNDKHEINKIKIRIFKAEGQD